MPDATTDEPFEAATAIPVNYTEENTTADRLVEMTDDSVHDSDLGSSSHKPLEGNVDTDMDTITDRPFDTTTTSINDVENTIKPTMNSKNSVSDDIPQNEPTNSPNNLMNDTEITIIVVEKSETAESNGGKTPTTTTDEPEESINDLEKGTSVHTTPETGRPSEISSMNETEFDLTIIDALEITSDSGNDKTEVQPTRVGLTPTTENVSEKVTGPEQDISTNGLLETTAQNYTELETTTIGPRAMTTNFTANDTNYPPETTKDPETGLGSTTIGLRTTTGKDKFTIGLERTIRNDTDSRNDTDQDFTTTSLLETTTKNFTKEEPITIGLGPTTKNDSNITERVDTSTIRPILSVTTSNSINDTKMEVYTTETGTWANQGK